MTRPPVALITGITGQDGALLAELLLAKGYVVHGLRRPASTPNTERIEHLLRDRGGTGGTGGTGEGGTIGTTDAAGTTDATDAARTTDATDAARTTATTATAGAALHLHHGDLTDTGGLVRLVRDVRPDELYNLGAQSHVHVSFDTPEYTADTDALGALRLLEALRILERAHTVRYLQASTSELFGNAPASPQNEATPFRPRSPYATAKLYAYWTTVNHREAYGMHASNAILFNHEGPTRGEAFVTRKVTRAVAAIACGRRERLRLGNLDARRDWGDARDHVEGMWRIVRHPRPGDYVLATGESHSVRDLVGLAFAAAGVDIAWEGSGLAEKGRDAATGTVRVEVDPALFRPAEVDHLVGDASRAREVLGWRPRSTFRDVVRAMVRADLDALAAGHGERRGGGGADRPGGVHGRTPPSPPSPEVRR